MRFGRVLWTLGAVSQRRCLVLTRRLALVAERDLGGEAIVLLHLALAPCDAGLQAGCPPHQPSLAAFISAARGQCSIELV